MIQFHMHNKVLSCVLECWYTQVWGMMTTNQKGFKEFFPSWNETPWYIKIMIILGMMDIKCEVENKIPAYVFKLQNISCKMKREVLHWLTEFHTSWNKTNYTRSDSKVMRLVPKKEFYFIYSSTKILSPSKYIPCACTHVFHRCCHCL